VLETVHLKRIIARAVQLGGCACLMGCAVTSPLATTKISGAPVETVSQIDLPEPESTQTRAVQLHSALLQELDRRSIKLAADANTLAEMSYSASPTTVGLYTNQSASPDSEATRVVETLPSRWYDRCETVRVRASLALFGKDSAEELIASTVQATVCDGDDADYAEIAQLLLDNVLAR